MIAKHQSFNQLCCGRRRSWWFGVSHARCFVYHSQPCLLLVDRQASGDLSFRFLISFVTTTSDVGVSLRFQLCHYAFFVSCMISPLDHLWNEHFHLPTRLLLADGASICLHQMEHRHGPRLLGFRLAFVSNNSASYLCFDGQFRCIMIHIGPDHFKQLDINQSSTAFRRANLKPRCMNNAISHQEPMSM